MLFGAGIVVSFGAAAISVGAVVFAAISAGLVILLTYSM